MVMVNGCHLVPTLLEKGENNLRIVETDITNNYHP